MANKKLGRPAKPEGRVRRYGVSFSEDELVDCDRLRKLLADQSPAQPSRADVFAWCVRHVLAEKQSGK